MTYSAKLNNNVELYNGSQTEESLLSYETSTSKEGQYITLAKPNEQQEQLQSRECAYRSAVIAL